jgi:hypothetical protein
MTCQQNNFDIGFVKGDHYSFVLQMQNEDGTALPFQPGDILFFSVKRQIKDTSYAFQAIVNSFNGNSAQIDIMPVDTKDLDPGEYFYDVQLTAGFDGRITTLIPISNLILIPEITHE